MKISILANDYPAQVFDALKCLIIWNSWLYPQNKLVFYKGDDCGFVSDNVILVRNMDPDLSTVTIFI